MTDMKQPYNFTYKTMEDVQAHAAELGINLPLSEDVSVLNTPFNIGKATIKNRMGVAPMEGADSLPDGSPSELTCRRYKRFAEGGAGLIWYEAVSVVQEGRSSLKQLLLTKDNLSAYQRMNDEIKEAGMKTNGYAPYLIMQANHSGRYSRPNPTATPEPIVAFKDPVLEKDHPLDDSRVATTDYLRQLEDRFGEASELAKQAGFDAVDIKSCHGYLFAEMAGAFTREDEYGGSFENRFRLLFNSIRNAQQAQTDDFQVLSRIGIYDNIPYPYGFGMQKDGTLTMDMEEPLKLMNCLYNDLHVPFVNITIGDPHYDAYVTRPFNQDIKFLQQEDPMLGVARIFNGAGEIKKMLPNLGISASAPSYMRQFAPNLAAGAIKSGLCDHVCFGRLSFANPNFPNEICWNGKLSHGCMTCSKCSELLRAGTYTGCVLFDKDVYLPIYQEINANK